MDSAALNTVAYWESAETDLRLHPRRPLDVSGLSDFLQRQCQVEASIVLPTSGTSGAAKFVVLPKTALLVSAAAVNQHLGASREDRWLAGLADFHVGGLGIYARSYLSGSPVVTIPWDSWGGNGRDFVHAIESHGITLTSLTPTHLHDLVRDGCPAPSSLRAVLLGGGRIEERLVSAARALGWPIRASYGMTEAASQIATAVCDEIDELPILPHWQCRIELNGRLALRGPALFSGYAERVDGRWIYRTSNEAEGWFVTGDRCAIQNGFLKFLGRADDLVKISGELVSLGDLDHLASGMAQALGSDAAVVAVPDARREHALIVVVEGSEIDRSSFLKTLNHALSGIEQIREIHPVEALPRTALGKVDRAVLVEWIRRDLP